MLFPTRVNVSPPVVQNDGVTRTEECSLTDPVPNTVALWPHAALCPQILSDPVPPWLAEILGWRSRRPVRGQQANYLYERHGGHSLGFITVHFTIIIYQVVWSLAGGGGVFVLKKFLSWQMWLLVFLSINFLLNPAIFLSLPPSLPPSLSSFLYSFFLPSFHSFFSLSFLSTSASLRK